MYTLHSRCPARAEADRGAESFSLPRAVSDMLCRVRHGRGGLQGDALDCLADISDLWELAGSSAFEQGSIAIVGSRWALNILFFSRDLFNSHFQTPDDNFASSDKMLFIVAYISYVGESG